MSVFAMCVDVRSVLCVVCRVVRVVWRSACCLSIIVCCWLICAVLRCLCVVCCVLLLRCVVSWRLFSGLRCVACCLLYVVRCVRFVACC